MAKKQLVSLICGALLCTIPSLVFAGRPNGGFSDINVGTIYFTDGTKQSTATLQGPQGPVGAAGPQGPMGTEGPTGPIGANGYNSLILIAEEISGSNCANGGTKIQVGLDLDRNGALDVGEVLQTKYICNGTTSVTPIFAPITVIASPSQQTVNAFTNITATLKNPDGTPAFGSVSFRSSGTCMLYDPYSNNLTTSTYVSATSGGTASIAMTNINVSGGPCIVTADYFNSYTQTAGSGSTLATFVSDNGTTPVTPTPSLITVTASPSTQTVNSYTNITATLRNADGTPAFGTVSFRSSGTCMLYDPYSNNLTTSTYVSATSGGTASIAMTNTNVSGGPCIVTADYFNSYTQISVGGSALATFVP